jgi:hypothetical protein
MAEVIQLYEANLDTLITVLGKTINFVGAAFKSEFSQHRSVFIQPYHDKKVIMSSEVKLPEPQLAPSSGRSTASAAERLFHLLHV